MTDDTPERDRLPRWLFDRYSDTGQEWEELGRGDRIRWQEEADTVVRAVVALSIYEIVRRR